MIASDYVFERNLECYEEFSYDNEKIFWELSYKKSKFYALSKFNSCSKKVWVFLNGATSGSDPRTLNRWSWGDRRGASFISISDPGISLDDGINLNWYSDNFTSVDKPVVRFLDLLLSENSISPSDLIFYGSSGGGYAALMFAAMYPGSSAVAINPQENPLNYFPAYVDKWLDHNDEGRKALGVIEFFKKSSSFPSFILKQNVKDTFHYENHFNKIMSKLPSVSDSLLGDVSFVLYSDLRGHSAVPLISSLDFDEAQPALANNRSDFTILSNSFFRIPPVITDNYIMYEFKCCFDTKDKVLIRFTHNPDSIMNNENVSYSEAAGNFIYLKPSKYSYYFYFKKESQGDFYVSGWFNKKEIKLSL